MNDVTSNEEMVSEGSELGLREALLKFRGPGTGDSEGGEEIEMETGGCVEGLMVSVSSEKDGLSERQELSRSS